MGVVNPVKAWARGKEAAREVGQTDGGKGGSGSPHRPAAPARGRRASWRPHCRLPSPGRTVRSCLM